jgi:hypothetical protein
MACEMRVLTDGFLDSSELFEFLTESILVGVPCEATRK